MVLKLRFRAGHGEDGGSVVGGDDSVDTGLVVPLLWSVGKWWGGRVMAVV